MKQPKGELTMEEWSAPKVCIQRNLLVSRVRFGVWNLGKSSYGTDLDKVERSSDIWILRGLLFVNGGTEKRTVWWTVYAYWAFFQENSQ